VTKIWTIGHSSRTIEEFIGALQANEIKLVADVRLLPGSKRYPQFNKEELAKSLNEQGIEYEHFPQLGRQERIRVTRRGATNLFAVMRSEQRNSPVIARLHEMVACARSGVVEMPSQNFGLFREVIHIVDARTLQLHPFTAKIVNGKLDYSQQQRDLSIYESEF
jgi:hypothetical protein